MQKIGKGAFRIVYEDPANPQMRAVKVPRENTAKYGRVMNAEEIKAAREFPDLFPRVYSQDLDALVVDRADPMVGDADLFKRLPELEHFAQRSKGLTGWQLFREIVELLRGKMTPIEFRDKTGLRAKHSKNLAVKYPVLEQIALAADTLDIDVKDIDQGNLGISRRTGEMVIIDASTMHGFGG